MASAGDTKISKPQETESSATQINIFDVRWNMLT